MFGDDVVRIAVLFSVVRDKSVLNEFQGVYGGGFAQPRELQPGEDARVEHAVGEGGGVGCTATSTSTSTSTCLRWESSTSVERGRSCGLGFSVVSVLEWMLRCVAWSNRSKSVCEGRS